jgi:lysophospholipase L1-like esterase
MRYFKALLIVFFSAVSVFGQGTPTIQLKTAAELVDYHIPSINSKLTAIVAGLSSETDGLGGVFNYIASSVAATNTTDVFSPLSGVGRWLRIDSVRGSTKLFNTTQFTTNSGSLITFKSGALVTNINHIGDATFSTFNGPPNTNIVRVAPYDTVAAGAGNIGPTTGQTSYNWLGYAHIYRIRQNGTITQVKFYTASLANVTGIFINIWRKTGTTYDLISTSANLLGSVSASTMNTVATSLAAQEGDFIGGRITYSSASAQVLVSKSVATATTYSVNNSTPSSTGFAWESQTAAPTVIVPVECSMSAPFFAAIGDSIVSGLRSHASFVDTFQDITDIPGQMPYSVGRALNYTYQNMGIGGQTIGNVESRFNNDVVLAHPRFVILEGGVNDLIGGNTTNTILTSYTNILAACVAASIQPVVCGILPFRGYLAGGTDQKSRDADTINNTLSNIVSASNGIFVNPRQLGIFYPSGDAGNLWTLNPQYDGGDGIHPSPVGYAFWANLILQALGVVQTTGDIHASSLSVQQNIALSGDNDRIIGVSRSTNYHAAGGSLTLLAGSAVGGVADTAGGDLILSGGDSTGTGKSSIVFKVPPLALTGTSDNVPTEMFRLESTFGLLGAYSRLTSAGGDAVHYFFDGSTYKFGVGYDSTLGAVGFFGTADGADPIVYYDNTFFTSLAPLLVRSGSGTTSFGDAVAHFYSSNTKEVWTGFDTTNNVGLIGAVEDGIAHRPLVLSPQGAGLGVGLAGASPSDYVHIKTVTRDLVMRLESAVGSNSVIRFYDPSGGYKGGVGMSPSEIGIYNQLDAGFVELGITRSNGSGIFRGSNAFTFQGGAASKVIVAEGTNTVDQSTAQLYVGQQDGTHYGWMGYNNSLDRFLIGSINSGVAHTPLVLNPLGGWVVIGSTTIDPSAALDITSTTTGLLVPRMTSAQRTAISSPANGLIVYQTDSTPNLYFRVNGAWVAAGGGSGEVNTASNLGNGVGVFNSKSGVDLRFNSLTNGTFATWSSNANMLSVEVNVAADGVSDSTKVVRSDDSRLAGAGGQTDERFASGTGATTDGTTPVSILNFTIAGGSSCTFEVTAIAIYDNGGTHKGYGFKQRGILRNNGVGAAGIVHLEPTPWTEDSDALTPGGVTISNVAGTQGGLQIFVTGSAAKTVGWKVSIRYTSV